MRKSLLNTLTFVYLPVKFFGLLARREPGRPRRREEGRAGGLCSESESVSESATGGSADPLEDGSVGASVGDGCAAAAAADRVTVAWMLGSTAEGGAAAAAAD